VTISEKVREAYERLPYPFGDNRALKRQAPRFDCDWIRATGPGDFCGAPPKRILVAGCGDGTEAFIMRRQFPHAQIVAVDSSKRSIAIAKRLQQRVDQMINIRFVVADLASSKLAGLVGVEFDLITCHGVLSYIPGTKQTLANFARCLAPEGALYLGVNGAAHISTRLRRALPCLDFDLDCFQDDARLRGVLGLCDAVLADEGQPAMSGRTPGFLASDVFGPLNKCLSLSKWVSLARRSGLHFMGNWSSNPLFRRIAGSESYAQLIPRSRAQVAGVLESLVPSPFHRLVFSRTPKANPPWEDRRRLLKWAVSRTSLYKIRFPKPSQRMLDRLRPVEVSSAAFNSSSEWRMPEWELELLRRADGKLSLGKFLAGIPLRVPFPELRKQIYLLYQLGIVEVRPPARD
jgi:SAM-dependent methyltransferase